MAQELICQVDEQDRLIGSCLRGEAHRLGLRHRAVHILVFNQKGEVFMQKRAPSKDVNPGLWDTSAAGHVDFGESYDDCAKRELHEELGIVDTLRLDTLFKLQASADTGWEYVQVYRLLHLGALFINTSEISEGRWFAPADVDAWLQQSSQDLTSSFQAIWRQFSAVSHRQSPI